MTRTLCKALFVIALALGLASTIAAGTHPTRAPTEAADAIGWFGLYGVSDEGGGPVTPFLPLPECMRCGRDQQNGGAGG